MLPYRTEDGLYLEDDGVLIPWGTSLDPDHPTTGAEVRMREKGGDGELRSECAAAQRAVSPEHRAETREQPVERPGRRSTG